MMGALAPFNFGDFPVRIEDREGALWFVLPDVCRVLEIANVADAASRLDDDERDVVGITDTMGREQQTTIVSESGLYSLVLRSRKAEARAFKKWITAEILPAIRRTGGYGMPPAPDLNDNATLRALLLGKLGQMDVLAADNKDLKGKAEALDRLTNAAGTLCVTDAAKSLGLPPKRLFGWLIGHSWIYRRNGSGALVGYQNKLDSGLLRHKITRLTRTDGSTRITEQVLVTAKGLAQLAAHVPGAHLQGDER
jgi:prophage antirepressor-like protein